MCLASIPSIGRVSRCHCDYFCEKQQRFLRSWNGQRDRVLVDSDTWMQRDQRSASGSRGRPFPAPRLLRPPPMDTCLLFIGFVSSSLAYPPVPLLGIRKKASQSVS
ncbi:hypothetical protein ACLOJK_036010 [Asimina triloba]